MMSHKDQYEKMKEIMEFLERHHPNMAGVLLFGKAHSFGGISMMEHIATAPDGVNDALARLNRSWDTSTKDEDSL